MKTDTALRDELVFELLTGHAHMSFDQAVAAFPPEKMNETFPNGDYTFWHLLEHIRRTQEDILDFMISPDYKEREWPTDYWPEKGSKAEIKDWDKTISLFLKDRTALQKIILDPATDLYKKFPHGTGQTVLREINVIVDHNAYHLGEFAIMRQVLSAWNKKHK